MIDKVHAWRGRPWAQQAGSRHAMRLGVPACTGAACLLRPPGTPPHPVTRTTGNPGRQSVGCEAAAAPHHVTRSLQPLAQSQCARGSARTGDAAGGVAGGAGMGVAAWRCHRPSPPPPQTDIARLDQGACIPLRRPYRPPGLARDGASPHVERGLRRGRPPPPTWCPAHSAGRPPPLPSGVHTALRCWSASWPPGGRWWAGVAPGAGGRLGVSPSTPWTFAVPEIADGILTDGCRGQGRSCAR
jgi:hypothetical protein